MINGKTLMPFSELLEDATKQGTKLQTANYLREGKYPIIDQGQEQIAGYTDETIGAFDRVPCIVFGDHTRIIKYIEQPFFLGADGVKVLCPKSGSDNVKYLYYALQAVNIPDTGYNRHFKWLKESNIVVYPKEQQDRIVDALDKVDSLISLRKKQLQKLDDLIKARFVEMFGDVIHNDRGWSYYRFSDIATSRLGKMLDAKQQTGKNKFPYLANFNVQWFRFELDNLNEMDFSQADQKEFELREDDLLVCEGGEIGRCAVWHNQIQPCFFQKAIHRVRCDTRIVLPDYLAWWFKYQCDHNGFAAIEGAKATIAHLPGAKLKSLQVAVPPIDVQHKFISYVALVDYSRRSIQQGLEKLEQMKQALMQKHFG